MAHERQILGFALNRSVNDRRRVIRTQPPHHLELGKRRAHAQERMARLTTAKFPAVPDRRRRRAAIPRQFSQAHRVLVPGLRQRAVRVHRQTHGFRMMNEENGHGRSAATSLRICSGVSTDPYRLTTSPLSFTRNLVKFDLMAAVPRMPRCSLASHLNNGCPFSPLIRILANIGNDTSNVALQKS